MRMPRIIDETARGCEFYTLEDNFYKERKIFMTGFINEEVANELIKQLMYLNQENPEKGITLYINSSGGELVSGLAVYDCIRLMKAKVRTVCTGMAASIASIIFLAGDKREMLPHTQIMIHDPTFTKYDVGGKKPLELQMELKKIFQARDALCEVISERTGRSREEVYEKTKTDSFFSVIEALEFGLATGVVTTL